MIVPVLQFNGNCADAIALYEKAFEVKDKKVEYFRDAPDSSGLQIKENTRNKIMHSGMTICGTFVNLCDTMDENVPVNALLLNVMATDEEVRKAFEVLSADGEVIVDLGPQFFSPLYASVKDRFGVRWQLITL